MMKTLKMLLIVDENMANEVCMVGTVPIRCSFIEVRQILSRVT